jgi:DNA-directed RNA polymerase I, II, and III subunit RPABC2
MDDGNIVHSGDPSAVQAALKPQKNSVADLKKKKIPKEKRTTTPYMTKYEKARVLGTRALQIRYVLDAQGNIFKYMRF